MRRRLFPILAALSLLLWLATAVLLVRGITHADSLARENVDEQNSSARHVQLTSAHGRLTVSWGYIESTLPGFFSRMKALSPMVNQGWQHRDKRVRSGIQWWPHYSREELNANPPMIYTQLSVPNWMLLVAFAVLPVVWLIRRRRARRRLLVGRCRQCGYDLRATPDRCPECGATPDHAVDLPAAGEV
jgi:hypothetical protein